MKKYFFKKTLLISIILIMLIFGGLLFRSPVLTQGQSMSICQLIDLLISIDVITASKADLAKQIMNCSVAPIDSNSVPPQSFSSCPVVECFLDSCPGKHLPDIYGCTNCSSACSRDIPTVRPMNGVCGSTLNSCNSGSFFDITDTSASAKWNCNGTNGGTSVTCPTPFPINGACNNVYSYTCLSGTFIDVTDTSGSAKWNCNGSSGGTNATCSVSLVSTAFWVTALCGENINTCAAGTFMDDLDTATENKWSCLGLPKGVDATCSILKQVYYYNNTCGATINTCASGSFFDLPDDTTSYKWSCLDLTRGTNITCQKTKSIPLL